MREEPVRQWCAHELLRAYGYPVTDLSFEEPVKVGSKTYRMDILVRRRNSPWLVIECKEPEYGKHEHAMEQAVSYAGAESVKAEFALYTNGKVWNARRCVSGLWTPVADIPHFEEAKADGSIDDLLLTMEVLMPLLHKLDERLEGSDARRFLEALQRFFHGRNLLTRGNDRDLCFATDNVLRVLSVGMNDLPYAAGKLSGAGQCYERYRERAGIGQVFCLPLNGELWQDILDLKNGVASMIERGTDSTGEMPLIRLNLALLDYGREVALRRGALIPLTPQINATLREYLKQVMAVQLNLRLPDTLEEVLSSDMKIFCGSAWEELTREDERERRATWRDLRLALIDKLLFWRKRQE